MKKIVFATTVLAFASVSYAVTVSGEITSQYQKEGDLKTLKTKGEVLFSGSKTSSNGITFGGTYKVLVKDAQSSDDSYAAGRYTRATSSALTVRSSKDDGSSANRDGMTVTALSQDGTYRPGAFAEGEQTQSQISAFVSSSFGRVDMGRHSTAARALGGKAFGVQTADDRTIRGITYTTPTLSGFRAAYTWSANADEEKSMAVGYATNFAGTDVKAGWGNIKKDGKTETAWGLSAGMAGFTVEYGQGTDGDKRKFDSVGVKYEGGQFLVSYYTKKSPYNAGTTAAPNWDTTNKNNYLTAEYTVVEGMKIFAKDNKEEGVKKTYIGTTISF